MRLLLFVILIFQISCYSDTEIIEGRLYSSPFEFQTSRMYPDSIALVYLDTIDRRMTNLINENPDAEQAKEYFFLKRKNLLSTHCFFMMVENENTRFRVYFEDRDFLKIKSTEWFEGGWMTDIFVKVKASKIKEYIYFCENIIEIEEIEREIEYLDTIHESIEIYPLQLTPQEIKELYFLYDSLKYIPNLDTIFPHLERYFEVIDEGFIPFTADIDGSSPTSKVDNFLLNDFLFYLKMRYELQPKK